MRLRMAVVAMFLSLTVFSGVSGQATPSAGTPVASVECAGAAEYIVSIQALSRGFINDLETAGIDLDSITSLTATDFGTASTLAANASDNIGALAAPPAAVQANADFAAIYGTFSQLFQAAQMGGLFATVPYADALEVATDTSYQSALVFELTCNVAFYDHDDDGEPEVGLGGAAPPSSGATPIAATGSGTRENPVPVGTTVTVDDDWQVTVVSVQPDTTDLVLAHNTFNEQPAPGNQFYIAQVSVVYIGSESDSFYDGDLAALGPSSVAYSTSSDGCGVIPDELAYSEVFPGGTVTGNVCWSVATGDTDALVMYYSPADSEDRVFFSLEPTTSNSTPVATPVATR